MIFSPIMISFLIVWNHTKLLSHTCIFSKISDYMKTKFILRKNCETYYD